MNKELFKDDALKFLDTLFSEFSSENIQLEKHWSIDHLCFRTDSDASYESFRELFKGIGKLLIESPVNGRLISTFKLNEPIQYRDWMIDLVELPAPKKGKTTKQGFEHIEVVCDLPFKEILNRFQGKTFSTSGLSKLFNQELEIELKNGAVKFHHLSLESVINLENNQKVYRALMDSKILEILKPFDPLVVGTFPLNLSARGSDVDILIHMNGSETLQMLLNDFENVVFDSATANLTFADVAFEIFAQSLEPVKQVACKHFQVEERLLKLGGESFHQGLVKLREQGLKTEPAFAEMMKLTGDPYQELLNLFPHSEQELREKLHVT